MPTSEFIKYIGVILVLLVLIILSYVFASGGIENANEALCSASAKVRQFWYHSPLINIPLISIGAATFSHISGWAPPLFCAPSRKILDLTKSNRTEIFDKIAKELVDCYGKYGATADDGPYDILMDNAPNPQICSIMHLKLGTNKLNMSDLVNFFVTYNVTSISVRDCHICANQNNEYCPAGFVCKEDGSVCEQQYRDCEKERIPGVKICPCQGGYHCKPGDPTKCVNNDDPSKEVEAPICFNYTEPYACRVNLTYADIMMTGKIIYDTQGISTCNSEGKSVTCPDGKSHVFYDPIFCHCNEPYGDYAYCLNLTKLKEEGKITQDDICAFVEGRVSIEDLCKRYANDKEEFNCAATNSELMCDDSYGCVWPKIGYALPFYGFISRTDTNLYSVSDNIITGEVDLFIFFADHYIRALLESGDAKLSDITKFMGIATPAVKSTMYFYRFFQASRWLVGAAKPLGYWKTLRWMGITGIKNVLRTSAEQTASFLYNPPMRYVAISAASGVYTGATSKVPVAFSIPPICGGGCGHTAGGKEAWSEVAMNCGVECVPCGVAATGTVLTGGATVTLILKQCIGCIACLSTATASSITCPNPKITLSQDSIFLCYNLINPAQDTTPGCGGMEERCCSGDQCDYDYLTCKNGKCIY
jgi:hypothetical protein